MQRFHELIIVFPSRLGKVASLLAMVSRARQKLGEGGTGGESRIGGQQEGRPVLLKSDKEAATNLVEDNADAPSHVNWRRRGQGSLVKNATPVPAASSALVKLPVITANPTAFQASKRLPSLPPSLLGNDSGPAHQTASSSTSRSRLVSALPLLFLLNSFQIHAMKSELVLLRER